MCGCYTIRRFNELVGMIHDMNRQEFDKFLRSHGFHAMFNIKPSRHVPIVRLDGGGNRVLDIAGWGFVPAWMKGKPKQRPPINAVSETVTTKSMFRQVIRQRRCLVPADGFYEWKGKQRDKPHFIHFKDDRPFSFAGIWDCRTNEDGQEENTFAFLTTQPGQLMKPLHDRMPVILEHKSFDRWLDHKNTPQDLSDLFKPFDGDEMEAYSVSTKVNFRDNDGPELIKRFTPAQGELFE